MSAMPQVRVALIGLGQAGSRFDEEPGRACWSHAGAFMALGQRARIVAGVDPDAGQRHRFATRCPDARVLEGLSDLSALAPDVAVIATPAPTHAAVLQAVLERVPARVLVVEKPLGMDAHQRAAAIHACQARGTILLVHYNRRFSPVYRRMRAMIADGAIGTLHSIGVRAPNRLWSIGSHAVDLLCMMAAAPPVDVRVLHRPRLTQDGEPAADALVQFESGVVGCLSTQGPKHALIFEVEAVGEQGRLTVDQNGARLRIQRMGPSPRYAGYRELGEPEDLITDGEVGASFVAVAEQCCDLIAGVRAAPTCSGPDAARSEALLDAITEALNLESTTDHPREASP